MNHGTGQSARMRMRVLHHDTKPERLEGKNMNKNTLLLVAIGLLLAPFASAAFDDTNDDQTPDLIFVSIADTASSVNSTRAFTLDANGTMYLDLEGSLPTGYNVSAAYSDDDGASESVITWDPTLGESDNFTVLVTDEALLRYEVSIPEPDDRTAGDTAAVTIHAFLEVVGVDPSIGHQVQVRYYDPATDADGDGLLDAWEESHFGHTDFNGTDDPDDDGYSNLEEHDAGSDPSSADSTPQNVLISGGGASVDDRDVGNIVAGLIITIVAVFVTVIIAADKSEKKAAGIAIAAGSVLLLTIVILTAVDAFDTSSTDWAWWTAIGHSWFEWTMFGVGLALIFGVGTYFATKVAQSKEDNLAWQIAAVGVAWTVLFGILFWWADLNIPL